MVPLFGSILLILSWIVSFFLVIKTTHRKLSYVVAILAAGVILWREVHLLVIQYDFAQLAMAAIFLSSLTVAATSDLHEMLIPRFCSLWLVPFWIFFAYNGIALISFNESVVGALLGYFIPSGISLVFWHFTGKRGIGEGDMELLAMIGAFVGACSALTTLYLGTIITLIVGLPYLYFIKKNIRARLPFAPALALGALLSFHICLI